MSELLSPRQREVARLVGEGLSYAQIAATLGISLRTVHNHIAAIDNRIEADGTSPYRRIMRWALEQEARVA